SQQDRHRLSGIGADPGRVQLTGNLKFDVVAPDETPMLRQLRAAIPPTSQVLVCGSTVEGAEALLINAFKNVQMQTPDALLILEPAQFGKPIFVGPYTENFRDIISIFQRENAVHVITPHELESQILSMLTPRRQAMGTRALEVFRSQSGATQRTQDALEVLMW